MSSFCKAQNRTDFLSEGFLSKNTMRQLIDNSLETIFQCTTSGKQPVDPEADMRQVV